MIAHVRYRRRRPRFVRIGLIFTLIIAIVWRGAIIAPSIAAAISFQIERLRATMPTLLHTPTHPELPEPPLASSSHLDEFLQKEIREWCCDYDVINAVPGEYILKRKSQKKNSTTPKTQSAILKNLPRHLKRAKALKCDARFAGQIIVSAMSAMSGGEL